MDLSTTYLGLELPHPFMPGASPLVNDIDEVRRLEDAGAAAIVMHSLFEEQITREQIGTIHNMEMHNEAFAEALSYFPEPEQYRLGPEEYLEQVRKVKEAVDLPVIASLNGVSPAGWLEYAQLIREAGADAIELNVYYLATDLREDAAGVEKRTVECLKNVKGGVSIPVAVKLSPFFSSMANMAAKLDAAGADGMVLFNRFYQPDIDVEALDTVSSLKLSDSSELLLRLRWLAILSGRVSASLAVSGGVHTPLDAIKAIMAGAHAVQMVSALLSRGAGEIAKVRDGVAAWLDEHEYESLRQMQGSMSLERSPNPGAYERANYMRILAAWGT